MTLGMELRLVPGHIVLDGDPAHLPKKCAEPPIFGQFLVWPNGSMHQDATWYEGRPQPRRLCVRWGPSSPLQKGGRATPQFLNHVYCGQTAGWIKMPLGTEAGLGPGDIGLDGDPASHKKEGHRHPPNFRPIPIVAKRLYCIRIPLGTEVGLILGDIVLDGDWGPSPLP